MNNLLWSYLMLSILLQCQVQSTFKFQCSNCAKIKVVPQLKAAHTLLYCTSVQWRVSQWILVIDILNFAWSQLSNTCKLNENKWFRPGTIVEKPTCIDIWCILCDRCVCSLIHGQLPLQKYLSMSIVNIWYVTSCPGMALGPFILPHPPPSPPSSPAAATWLRPLWAWLVSQLRSWKIRPISLPQPVPHALDETKEKRVSFLPLPGWNDLFSFICFVY